MKTCIHSTLLLFIRSSLSLLVGLCGRQQAECLHTSTLIQPPVCMLMLQGPSSCRKQVVCCWILRVALGVS